MRTGRSVLAVGVSAATALLILGHAHSQGLSGELTPASAPVGQAAGAKPAVPESGIAWEPSLDAAKARANKEGKPVLLLHLFGRLDEEFC